MNVEELYNYCLSIHEAEASTPFNKETVVMKICGKMFALIPLNVHPLCISLKCDPQKAIDLRERYQCVTGAYHMNKTHWNTIIINGEMPDEEIKRWIHHSVSEVMKKLPKKIQKEYYDSSGR